MLNNRAAHNEPAVSELRAIRAGKNPALHAREDLELLAKLASISPRHRVLSPFIKEEAARSIDIDAKTLLRWMKKPEFQTAYREARRQARSTLLEGRSALFCESPAAPLPDHINQCSFLRVMASSQSHLELDPFAALISAS